MIDNCLKIFFFIKNQNYDEFIKTQIITEIFAFYSGTRYMDSLNIFIEIVYSPQYSVQFFIKINVCH